MTATTAARGPLAFDPDHYLDCRQPSWESYEERGLIRFERPVGSRTALVFVDHDCIEVVGRLEARAPRQPMPSR
jgi:hypothetical protein